MRKSVALLHSKLIVLTLLAIIVFSVVYGIQIAEAKPKPIEFDMIRSESGFLYAADPDYNTAWSTPTAQVHQHFTELSITSVGQRCEVSYYDVMRDCIAFDTRSLQGKKIEKAELIIEAISGSFYYRDFTVRVMKWTDAEDGFDVDDYSKFDGIFYDDGSSHVNKWTWDQNPAVIPLNDTSIINTNGGLTGICMRISTEVAKQPPSPPYGDERVAFFVQENTRIYLSITLSKGKAT